MSINPENSAIKNHQLFENEEERRVRARFYLRSVIIILLLDVLFLYASFAQLMSNNNVAVTISSGIQMTVQGSVQNNAGTTISNAGTIDLSGNWINNAGNNCFGASQGTVILNGAAQDIGGSSSTLFHNLTLTGSGTKTLLLNTTVGGLSGSGILDLGNRLLDLNMHSLSVSNPSPLAIATLTGSIISEQTDNSSKVIWSIGSSIGLHVVPFGTAAGVQIPLGIDVTSGTANDVIVSTYITAPDNTPYPLTPTLVTHVNNQSGADNSNNMVDRFWQVDQSGAATFDLTFTYAPAEMAAGGNINVTGQRWNSPALGWDLPLPGQSNPSAYVVTVPGVLNSGAWALTLEASPLPVTLLSFQVQANKKRKVDISWVTSSEINNDYFLVESSKDGITFSAIAEVDGAGNSTVQHSYQSADENPFDGINYYRLKQIDFDGQYSYSEIRTVLFSGDGATVIVFPNPATTSAYLLFNALPENAEEITFELFDTEGKIITAKTLFEMDIVSENSFRIDRGSIAPGIYFYSVSDDKSNLVRGKITFN